MADNATRARLLPGDYARILSVGVLLSYAAVVALALAFRATVLSGDFLSTTALFSASFLAAVACLTAWRLLPREVNLPWLVFGLAAVLGSLAHAASLLGDVALRTSATHITWGAGYALFLAGVTLVIQQSERGRWSELGMDVALVAVAAAVVMLRWAPGMDAVPTDASVAATMLVIFAPVAAFCTALFIVVLLASPPASLPMSSAYALAAGTICLMISAIPQVMRGSPCCHADSNTTLAAIGMWVLLMFAGGMALRGGGHGVVVPQGERLRQYVAPTVAIMLAGVSVDTSLNPPVERRTAIAIGVLAVLLALRLTQLLQATRSQVAERRELAQTRALIEVSRALAGANNLDVTLRTVTDWARRVLNAKAAAIELLAPDQQELELRAATGLPPSVVGMTFPLAASFSGWVVKHGELRVAVSAADDPNISQESAAILGKAPLAAVPLRYGEEILGVLTCIGTRPFDSTDVELLSAFANHAATAIEDARLFEQVRMLSVTDELTGLANRRRLDRELQREFAAARRGRRLVAVMFDLDDFKQHNDRYGHLAGDRALRHFAEALAGTTRAMNLAARFGGDEFFALLADSDRAGAQIFVDRVREKFQNAMREAGNPELSVSAGIAEFRPDMHNAVELVEAADRALYISKSEGLTSR